MSFGKHCSAHALSGSPFIWARDPQLPAPVPLPLPLPCPSSSLPASGVQWGRGCARVVKLGGLQSWCGGGAGCQQGVSTLSSGEFWGSEGDSGEGRETRVHRGGAAAHGGRRGCSSGAAEGAWEAGPREPLTGPLYPRRPRWLLSSELPASMLLGDTHSFFSELLFLNESSLMGFLLSDS